MKTTLNGKGVMYYVDDRYYLPMATHSIESLNKVSDLPITIFTSFSSEFLNKDFKNITIVEIPESQIKLKQKSKHKCNSPAWRAKTRIYSRMPYDTTLYVDADTMFFKDPSEIMSDDYDIAACRAANFNAKTSKDKIFWNTFGAGFMVLNKNEKVLSFLRRTEEIFEDLVKNFDPKDEFKCNDEYALNLSYSENPYIVIKFLSSQWSVVDPIADLIENPYVRHSHNLQYQSPIS